MEANVHKEEAGGTRSRSQLVTVWLLLKTKLQSEKYQKHCMVPADVFWQSSRLPNSSFGWGWLASVYAL